MFKKFLSLFLSMCIISCFVNINLFVPPVCAEETGRELTEEDIPDPNLRAALRQALIEKNIDQDGKITDTALGRLKALNASIDKITELTGSDKGVTDLTGLQFCTNLNQLDLTQNYLITSIEPLSDLKNLTELTLSTCYRFSDIEKLADLTKLKSLSLYNCDQITDISSLTRLPNLTELDLSHSGISSFEQLRTFTNLETLILVGNWDIDDVEPLSDLEKLQKLVLFGWKISDISELATLKDLKYLKINGTQVTNIGALSGLENLTYLDLNGNQITDIDALSGLEDLTHLDLYNNQISEIGALSGLEELTHLNLCGNQISEIGALSGLEDLTYLDLSYNRISNVNPIAGLHGLSTLRLQSNRITDISPLKDMNNLTFFDCDSQEIISKDAVRLGSIVEARLPDLKGITGMEKFGYTPEYDGNIDTDKGKIVWQNLSVLDIPALSFESGISVGSVENVSFGGRVIYGTPKTYKSLSEESPGGIAWLQEEGDNENITWFGLKLGTITPSKDSEGKEVDLSDKYFYVEWISPEKMLQHPEYANLDPEEKAKIQESRGKLFYAGICDEYGNKIDVEFSAENPAKLYVKVGETWDTQDLQSVFITTDKDEKINISYDSDIQDPEGRSGYAVMNLTHFSPYFVYDAETSGVGDSPIQAPSSSSGSSNKNDSEEKLEEDNEEDIQDDYNNLESVLKDFFITGDSKTKIIAWSTVGLILTALGVLVFMRKYRKIK